MKIIHFTPSFLPVVAGAEIVVHNLASQQQAAGHDVYVLAPWKSWRDIKSQVSYKILPLFPRMKVDFIYGVTFSSRSWKLLLQSLICLYQQIHNFNIWHVHTLYPAGCACIDILKNKCKLVCTSHGMDIQTLKKINYGVRLDPVVDQMIRKKIHAFDAVIAISQSIRKEYRMLNIDPSKIYDIPNGALTDHISRRNVNKALVRKKYNLPEKKILLLTIGRNHPKKGFNQIPQIARVVSDAGFDFVWLMVGNDMDDIKQKAKTIGVEEYFRFIKEIGKDDNDDNNFILPGNALIDIYKTADIFIFPTLIESFGLIFIEAMAAQLPVITTNAPGASDAIVHNVNGLISPVGDANKMAQNIILLLKDRSLRKKIAATSLDISNTYEWSRITKMHIDSYKRIAGAI